jgi:hypothetical protein
MKQLTTTRDVITALGGDDAVGRMFGVGKTAVSNWRCTSRFPGYTALAMKEALVEKGFDAPADLWRSEIAKPAKRSGQGRASAIGAAQ